MIMSKADILPTPIRSRRAVLAGLASAAALPIAAAMPAKAEQSSDPIFAAIDAMRRAGAAMIAVDGDITDEVADPYYKARAAVMRTRPTTPPGLAALTTWTREEAHQLREDGSMLYADDLYTLSATIDDAVRGMSGLKPGSPVAGQP
jgi:hypothetical protein